MRDLKSVYKAPTEEAGLLALDKLEEKWGKKYPYPINSWKNNWDNLAVFFKYPEEIRTVIYTTNAVENLHRQFRKVTKIPFTQNILQSQIRRDQLSLLLLVQHYFFILFFFFFQKIQCFTHIVECFSK